MADRKRKFTLNVEGRFYVDASCIDCDLCRVTAPECFTANEEEGHSFVFKQPGTPEEELLCREALENCPVEAIGADGDDAAPSGACGAPAGAGLRTPPR